MSLLLYLMWKQTENPASTINGEEYVTVAFEPLAPNAAKNKGKPKGSSNASSGFISLTTFVAEFDESTNVLPKGQISRAVGRLSVK